MYMIWHQQIATNQPIGRLRPYLYQTVVSLLIGKESFALMGTEGEPDDNRLVATLKKRHTGRTSALGFVLFVR